MKQSIKWILSILILISFQGISQNITQTIKGTVIDKTSEKSLIGASITLVGSKLGTVSGENGRFVLKNIPIGRQKIAIEFNGYKSVVIPELLVTSGKEVELEIPMDQSIASLQEVTVTGAKGKKGGGCK